MFEGLYENFWESTSFLLIITICMTLTSLNKDRIKE